MKNKINIAELLKDCPKGMELDCVMYDNVTFERFDVEQNRCYFKAGPADTFWTTCYGKINGSPFGKCVIFPKGKTTWEEFQRPFEDGDIVATKNGKWIGITTGGKCDCFMPTYCVIKGNGEFEAYLDKKETWQFFRLATEEEKQKLFDAIKDNGYNWNAETKTLEKLPEPKFKVGDKVLWNYNTEITRTITAVEYSAKRGYVYWIVCKGCSTGWWGENELTPIPNKFDINTLKPFDKVLVRSDNSDVWECDFFSLYNPKCSNRFHCIGAWYNICIPYIGNEHLRGTTNDCDEYYKNWEE